MLIDTENAEPLWVSSFAHPESFVKLSKYSKNRTSVMSRSTRLSTRQVNEYLQEQEDGDYYFDGRTLCLTHDEYADAIGFDEEFEDFDGDDFDDDDDWDNFDDDDDWDDVARDFYDEPYCSELDSQSAAEILRLDAAIAALPPFEPMVLEVLPEGISEEQNVDMHEYRGSQDGLRTGGIWSCCALMFSYEGINFIAHVVSDTIPEEVLEAISNALGEERLARLKADKDSRFYLVSGFQYGEFARRICYCVLDAWGLAGQAQIFRGVFPMEYVGISSAGPFLVRSQDDFASYAETNERAWHQARLEELMALQDADALDESLLLELVELLMIEVSLLSGAEDADEQS
ncbi:MAG: hypothetical protein SFV17_07210 [Candidatus Obscuribacter sp.]|nr:hypothetical protein [Candidatus Obscuribacter sp.]